MKKIVKTIAYFLLSSIVFVLIYLLADFGLSRITTQAEPNTQKEVEIYILSNGVHTDIVLPIVNTQKDWSTKIKFENTFSKNNQFRYVAMGWGDKGFYLETPSWAELKPSVAFKAATGLSTTAIHATFYNEMIEDEKCKKIYISQSQYTRLIQYIENSFQVDANNQYINIKAKAKYGPNDAFYEAHGNYSMMYTCNSWANDALQSCGQKCALWTAFDKGIFIHYK